MTFEQAEKEMNKKGFFFTGKPSRKVGNYASRPIVFKDAQGNTHNYLSREHCAEYVDYEIENGFGLWAATEKDGAEYRAEAGPAVSEFYGAKEDEKAKHTPGPWSAQGWTVKIGNKTISTAAAGLTIGQADADAQLIAAAPELLAALERIEYCVSHKIGLDTNIDAINQARAAIAKAKGE